MIHQESKMVISTTARCEWWGFFGSFAWMFCNMYNFDELLSGDENGLGFVFPFLISIAAVMLVLAVRYKDNVRPLSRIAFFAGPPAILVTAVMPLFPPAVFVTLYILSGVLMAPVILRRIYGIVVTARPDRMFRAYFTAIAAGVLLHSIWVMLPLPAAVRFLIPAALAVPGWTGVSRILPERRQELPISSSSSKHRAIRFVLPVAAMLLLLFIANIGNVIIHSFFVEAGAQSLLINWLGGTLLPPAGFVLFAWFADKKRDMDGFVFGVVLTLLGLTLAFIPGDSILIVPLMLLSGLGAAVIEFLFLSFSLHFFTAGSRTLLMVSLGYIINVIDSALLWIADLWLPPFLMERELTVPILVFTAVCFIFLLFLIYFVSGMWREKSLAWSVMGLFLPMEKQQKDTVESGLPMADSREEAMTQAGFTDMERKVALQLIEGNTKSEIARSLHLPAGEVRGHLRQIRDKINGVPAQGMAAILERVTAEYRLTGREVQMLGCLSEGKTNAEIAAELFISEETVKFHVRNLMKKLPVDSRYQILSWLNGYKL